MMVRANLLQGLANVSIARDLENAFNAMMMRKKSVLPAIVRAKLPVYKFQWTIKVVLTL